MKKQLLYEKYHLARKYQRQIIGDCDFTYGYLIHLLKKYSSKKTNVLDIGCGVGTIDFYLASKGKKVFGIDISKNGIIVAKRNSHILNLDKNITFAVMEFPENIPGGKFDLIICSEVLEHLSQDKLAIIKISKLLSKSGVLIVSSPSQSAPLYRIGLLSKFDEKVGHLRRYTENSFKNLFKDSGLRILETKKTEGVFRNFLFTNSIGGFLLKFLNKYPISSVVTYLDNLTIPILGESNIYLVAKKDENSI